MTADKLKSLVLRIANAVPARYWLHFNYPQQNPWVMAIQVRASDREVMTRNDLHEFLVEIGFTFNQQAFVYTIPRTNDDGTPYRTEDGE